MAWTPLFDSIVVSTKNSIWKSRVMVEWFADCVFAKTCVLLFATITRE